MGQELSYVVILMTTINGVLYLGLAYWPGSLARILIPGPRGAMVGMVCSPWWGWYVAQLFIFSWAFFSFLFSFFSFIGGRVVLRARRWCGVRKRTAVSPPRMFLFFSPRGGFPFSLPIIILEKDSLLNEAIM